MGLKSSLELCPIDLAAPAECLFDPHEIPGSIHTIRGEQQAISEVEAGEVAVGGRVAAQRDLVVPGVQARDLQLQVVLVGPEPGQGPDGPFLAAERGRCRSEIQETMGSTGWPH